MNDANIYFFKLHFNIRTNKYIKYEKMTSNINEIGKKALELSNHDRALLIRQLLESLDDGDEEEEDEELWISEAKKRYKLYKQGKTSSKPSSVVLENAKNNLK